MSKLGCLLILAVIVTGTGLPTQARDLEPVTSKSISPIAQAETVKIKSVRLEPSDKGISVILETATGQLQSSTTNIEAKTATVDLPDAVLLLPDGRDFRADNPATGIANVRVTQVSPTIVRVSITGTSLSPTIQALSTDRGLTVTAAPALSTAQSNNEIEINVTGLRNRRGYRFPNAAAGTRSDISVKDLPQSIQVIPQQVIRDQQITTIDRALPNVSSVVAGGFDTNTEARYAIRGFDGAPIAIDGFRQFGFPEVPDLSGIEQIEVIKGPASILFGEIQPGGIINVVTKQPTKVPTYSGQLQAGSFGTIRPSIDLSSPLTPDGRVAARLNAAYGRSDSYRNFSQRTENFSISPVVTWQVSDKTTLSVNVQSQYREVPSENGTVAVGTGVANIPRERILSEPDDFIRRRYLGTGYNLNHQFSDEWKIQNTFRYATSTFFSDRLTVPVALDESTGQLDRLFATNDFSARDYSFQTSVTGKFQTGTIGHTLLAGVDYNHNDTNTFFRFNGFDPASSAPLNIFNPVYGAVARGSQTETGLDRQSKSDRYGIFVQDQIAFADNLKLSAGLRYESVTGNTTNGISAFDPAGVDFDQRSSAVTPRIGIVYQPTKQVSLYTSYSQSFNPSLNALTAAGTPIEPERGAGYEIGVKTELLDGRLAATLAYYDTIKQNVATADPILQGVSIATGEQRSNGVELDVVGNILPGWNVIASYAYTNARVTRDNITPSGNRLPGIPENSASLWTTYQLQSGDLQGLGFGVGFTFVGDRSGDLANSFNLNSHFLTNAGIFYRRDDWDIGLNFRNIFNVNHTTGIPFSRVLAGTPGEPFNIIGSISVKF